MHCQEIMMNEYKSLLGKRFIFVLLDKCQTAPVQLSDKASQERVWRGPGTEHPLIKNIPTEKHAGGSLMLKDVFFNRVREILLYSPLDFSIN